LRVTKKKKKKTNTQTGEDGVLSASFEEIAEIRIAVSAMPADTHQSVSAD